MAAPTISAYSNSNFTDTGNEATGSVSWNSGDLVVVLGVTADNAVTLATPATAGSGLTFAAITGFPTNTADNCKVYGWSATASATSSGTITSTTGGSGTLAAGIAVWVMASHNGLGNSNRAVGDTTDPYTVSLTRAGDNSAVLLIAGDWNAVSDTATSPTPAGSTERVGDNAGFRASAYNGYVADWADGGAAGTTAYGITGITGAQLTLGAVEVNGIAAAGGQPTVKRFGGVPFMGGRSGGVWAPARNDGVWARRSSGLMVPQRFKEAA